MDRSGLAQAGLSVRTSPFSLWSGEKPEHQLPDASAGTELALDVSCTLFHSYSPNFLLQGLKKKKSFFFSKAATSGTTGSSFGSTESGLGGPRGLRSGPCEHVSPSLQEKAEEVYRLYQNSPLSSHPVVALSELSTLCAGSCPDERTFYLVLLQLQKEKRVTVLEQNGEKVRGFSCPSAASPGTGYVCADMPASIPAWGFLSTCGRGSSNFSLSLRL